MSFEGRGEWQSELGFLSVSHRFIIYFNSAAMSPRNYVVRTVRHIELYVVGKGRGAEIGVGVGG